MNFRAYEIPSHGDMRGDFVYAEVSAECRGDLPCGARRVPLKDCGRYRVRKTVETSAEKCGWAADPVPACGR